METITQKGDDMEKSDKQVSREELVDMISEEIESLEGFSVPVQFTGHLNDAGSTVLTFRVGKFRGEAKPDKPLLGISVIVEALLPMLKYSSDEAARKDVKDFILYVSSLRSYDPKDENEKQV